MVAVFAFVLAAEGSSGELGPGGAGDEGAVHITAGVIVAILLWFLVAYVRRRRWRRRRWRDRTFGEE